MLRFILLLMVMVLQIRPAWCQEATADESAVRQIVLVAAATAPFDDISMQHVRRAYLAIPVVGSSLHPLRNQSDALLHEMFLQRIIFLSSRDYERRVVEQSFRNGNPKPPAFRSIDELVSELKTVPNSITYMWSDVVVKYPDIKVVKRLWPQ